MNDIELLQQRISSLYDELKVYPEYQESILADIKYYENQIRAMMDCE
jgi:hypothetical protein